MVKVVCEGVGGLDAVTRCSVEVLLEMECFLQTEAIADARLAEAIRNEHLPAAGLKVVRRTLLHLYS